jgi:2-dehydro-3-deoxyphosphogluconate aldolase / (4S)-4-hydroxy-2-oxoglutarate aldolase
VLTAAQLERAVEPGATFAVAPGCDPQLAREAQQHGVSFLPGVMTPTDVQSAMHQGVRLMKMFPAHLLGPEWIEAMADPCPEAAFVVTGGISAANTREFTDRGRGPSLPHRPSPTRRHERNSRNRYSQW